MHRGYTTPLVIAIMAFAVVAFLFLIDTVVNPDGTRQSTNQLVNQITNPTACTQEAKICPDGSAVGRSGPNCEFAECSSTTNTNSTTNQNTNTTTDPTAGWKTYTNTQLKYSIKYPSDWSIGLETDKQTTISGAGNGTPFTAPSVSITTSEPDQPSSCLLKEEAVTVLGESRLRQTQGCGYAGSNIATFIKKGSAYFSVSWTEDVSAAYPTYDLMLSTFTFTD